MIKVKFLEQLGMTRFFISRDVLSDIVNIEDFKKFFFGKINVKELPDEISLDLYLEYYNERSWQLGDKNIDSKISHAAKQKSERLTNDAEYRAAQAEKWTNFD